ncbi:MAG: DUF1428 domain-containing protein [Paracoccaceae bacterium]
MAIVDVVVIPVPDQNRKAYLREAKQLAPLFIECGATEVLDGWADDLTDGDVTSFPRAVQRGEGEAVAVGFVLWPSKRTRDSGWKKALADPRMPQPPSRIYDGKRMFFGGFDVIRHERKEP